MNCDGVTQWNTRVWLSNLAEVMDPGNERSWVQHDKDHTLESQQPVSRHLHSTSVHPTPSPKPLTHLEDAAVVGWHYIRSPSSHADGLSEFPVATPQVTTGVRHEEIFSSSFSLPPSFITPCRGGAKWPSSVSMKACMTHLILSIQGPSFLYPARHTG